MRADATRAENLLWQVLRNKQLEGLKFKRRVPVGRSGRTDEVARLVGALFSERIGFLTGETIYVDGGQGANH